MSCYSDFALFSFHKYVLKFSCIFSFVFTAHWSFTSFSMEIWSLIREMYFRRKKFYQKSGKNVFFWNTFMILDWKISFAFCSCIHVLNVESKLSKENLTTCERKISSYKPALRTSTILINPGVKTFLHERLCKATC